MAQGELQWLYYYTLADTKLKHNCSLQSLDWNGGLEWWTGMVELQNSAKLRSTHSLSETWHVLKFKYTCVAIAFASSLHTLCYGIQFNIDVVACIRSILHFLSYTMGDVTCMNEYYQGPRMPCNVRGEGGLRIQDKSHQPPRPGVVGHDPPGIFDPQRVALKLFLLWCMRHIKKHIIVHSEAQHPHIFESRARAPSPPPPLFFSTYYCQWLQWCHSRTSY